MRYLDFEYAGSMDKSPLSPLSMLLVHATSGFFTLFVDFSPHQRVTGSTATAVGPFVEIVIGQSLCQLVDVCCSSSLSSFLYFGLHLNPLSVANRNVETPGTAPSMIFSASFQAAVYASSRFSWDRAYLFF